MIAALLVALLAQATPQRDTRLTPATAGTGSIVGVVMTDEPQPRPLRRARVTAGTVGAALPRTVISGDDGSFLIDRLPEGSYTVLAAREGFVTMAHGATRPGRPGTPVTLAAQQSVRIDLRLPRGGVITGTVTGTDGQPAHGIVVSALAHRFVGGAGDRRYVPTGIPAGTTDDRGVYRIYGLPAGDYVIATQPPRAPSGIAAAEVRVMSGGAPSPTRLLPAQVFHPSATDVARASRITVRAGEERAGIDLQLQYVPLAVVSGIVSLAPGWSPVSITLTRADEVAALEAARTTRTDQDGRFSLPSVPPGQYRLLARGNAPPSAAGVPGLVHFAILDLAIAGEDVTNLGVAMQPGFTIAGQVVFEGDAPPLTLPVSLRSSVPAVMTMNTAGFMLPELQIDGTRFRMAGIIPGVYRLSPIMRGMNSPIGKWWLKSLVVDGRDILDAPLDLRQGTDNAVATFTDRVPGVTGVVTDARGTPIEGVNVIVLPVDRGAWFLGSRRVAAARTGREGRYSAMNLPPGEYRVALAPDLEPGEWFDPEVLERLLQTGTSLKIAGTDRQTVDLQIK